MCMHHLAPDDARMLDKTVSVRKKAHQAALQLCCAFPDALWTHQQELASRVVELLCGPAIVVLCSAAGCSAHDCQSVRPTLFHNFGGAHTEIVFCM